VAKNPAQQNVSAQKKHFESIHTIKNIIQLTQYSNYSFTVKPSGDDIDDDFEIILPDHVPGNTNTDSDIDTNTAALNDDNIQQQQQQQQRQCQSTTDAKRLNLREKFSKKKKLSAVEYEESRAKTASISQQPAAQQAQWLWDNYAKHSNANDIERNAGDNRLLTKDGLFLLPLPSQPLENRLQAAFPGSFQSSFINGTGNVFNNSIDNSNGSPVMLYISSSAIGACNFIKRCPRINRGRKIAKLFSKHIKIQEQQDLLTHTKVCVGAGTPNRIMKLVEIGALKLDNLQLVIVDVGLDGKKRTLLDVTEVRDDFWKLYNLYLKELGKNNKGVKLALECGDGDRDWGM